MPAPSLKSLLRPKSNGFLAVSALCESLGAGLSVVDPAGKPIVGETGAIYAESSAANARVPVQFEDATLGFVVGPHAPAAALASLLTHLTARESEGRALASEVLHLYREVHLIEQLSEQLSALLNYSAVSHSSLEQAQRLIAATHGTIVITDESGELRTAASFGSSSRATEECPGPLLPGSHFIASILERGVAEIVNNCASDPRTCDSNGSLTALISAPLRAGQRTVGIISLASTDPGASYSAADLKLLNTIALQTAAAIANSLLCDEMVQAARERAAYAAELQAASTVQQLLLQSASRSTPGFQVDSVYLPASEVGGDFFFVSPAPDGSLTAIVGDVSGKGLTAAMRVAMILGALRRETSYDPSDILSNLNNALIAQGQLGFTTACCVRIFLSGEFTLANAGHIAPYLSGREIATPPALPLGVAPDQSYELVTGRLLQEERLVLLSDGVPEARSTLGELYGFERLPSLTLMPARDIAEAAQQFGQEDDITVLTLAFATT
jgi:GAF domain-containing protein